MEGGQGDVNVNIDKVYTNSSYDVRKLAQDVGIELRKQRLGGGLL